MEKGKGLVEGKGNAKIGELQKEKGKKAKEENLPDRRKGGDMAAQALEKGDLPKAIENQQKALDELNKAGMMAEKGMMNDKGMMGDKGMPMAGMMDKGMMGDKGMPMDKGMMGDKGMPMDKGM